MNLRHNFLLALTIFFVPTASAQIDLSKKYFDKVIIWGHRLHSHTHSYIHWGFYRAFKHLGYCTYWLDNNDDISKFNFANSLFITEGQVDQRMPVREDCRYVLHHCFGPKYDGLQKKGLVLRLQVYENRYAQRAAATRLAPCTYFEPSTPRLYQPWATDLLPHEIDQVKKQIGAVQKDHAIYMVASIGGTSKDPYENTSAYEPFFKACAECGITCRNFTKVSTEQNIELVQRSLFTPALQSTWQCSNGYIPCRIFKNISYGQWGITNSKTVYELFDKKIIYNPDTYQLFFDALKKVETGTQSELFELMDFVRDHHTYINRVETILHCLDQTKTLVSKN